MPQDLLGLLSTTSPGARVARVAAVSASVAKSSGRTWGWGRPSYPERTRVSLFHCFACQMCFPTKKMCLIWYYGIAGIALFQSVLVAVVQEKCSHQPRSVNHGVTKKCTPTLHDFSGKPTRCRKIVELYMRISLRIEFQMFHLDLFEELFLVYQIMKPQISQKWSPW